MTELSKRFEEFLKTANIRLVEKELLIPIKTDRGILINDVLITSQENLKTVIAKNYSYKDIYLNAAAITIANMLALRKSFIEIDKLYQADQEYGKWFVDTQFLLNAHYNAKSKKDYDKADMLWARYQESRDKANKAKEMVQRLLF